MADFKIDLTGYSVPIMDGEVNTYTCREAEAQSAHFSATRRAIFVNGMANAGQAHLESAVLLSLVQMCPVVGLYNKTSGFVADLAQCLGDKNQFNGVSLSAQNKAKVGTLFSNKTSEAVIVQALSRNPAQVALFHLLRKSEYKTSEIFAHSQGNLILSNALQGIAAVDGSQAIAGRIVHTFGSPAVNWPKGITKLEHGFTFDPVNWLSGFDTSFSISKVGMPSGSLNPITHGFLEYLKKDPAFVVNRFRVGSWGMTFKMDEDGLAACLAAMGPNMPRVRAIFVHLDVHHNSDADDVAVRYVNLIRGSQPTTRALAADKDLVGRLVKVLDEGWTDAEEKKAISWLKAL